MRLCPVWLVCLLCPGCQLADVAPRPQPDSAEQLWQDGQQAMKAGNPAEAIDLYEESLAQNQQLAQNHLSLAAAFVERGDDARACEHLAAYLRTHPDHKNARFYYAELLLKQDRLVEARDHFERAVARGQDDEDTAHLIHCHGRIVEIAERLEEDYLDHLHRGIGMYLLAQERAAQADPEGAMPAEALLCKAAAELTRAHKLRPQEARPALYLHFVWRQLAQHGPSQRWLAEANRTAPFSRLTPAEQRRLHLAVPGDKSTDRW